MNKLLNLLAFTAILSGCAVSSTAPKFAQAPTPSLTNDKAVLYIYREYAEPTAFSATLLMDGKPLTSLQQQGFTWVYITPGKHRFTHEWPFLASMPTLNFEREFEPNKSYVFEMKGQVRLVTARTMVASTVISPVELEKAKKIMAACCRYVEPESAKL